ncbi:MAG TPA: HAMP domain-containing protein, partial [Myxococcaceae bacterium]|nr:HAMP domain-containing protein [Myxococcaceae bacterium]
MASGDSSLRKRLLWRVALPGALAVLACCALWWRASSAQALWAQPFLAGVLLAALIVGGAALWIEGRLMRPLRRLGRAVHRAAEGDFVVRAATPAGNGEVARLAASFNRLLARITALQADEVDVQRDLADAHEQLKLQQAFEAANALLERRLNELSLLYEVARSFTSTLELPELLARISTHVAERLSIPQFSIMLLN